MNDKTLSFTRRSLAEALDNVRCLSDLGPELIAAQVFAASAQQPAQAAPAGWTLVPVDPTEEILDAICLAKNMTRRGLAVLMNMQELESIYRAMIAAAPAAPVAQEPVAFYWKDVGVPAQKHGPYFGWPTADVLERAGKGVVPVPLYTAPPAATERPGTVKVPREVLRVLTDTAISEWHDPGENESSQDRNECLCCGVEDGHNTDCAVAIALRLLAGGAA